MNTRTIRDFLNEFNNAEYIATGETRDLKLLETFYAAIKEYEKNNNK